MYEKTIKADEYEETVYAVFDKKINDEYVIERSRLPFLIVWAKEHVTELV
jgi:hypothetical protein